MQTEAAITILQTQSANSVVHVQDTYNLKEPDISESHDRPKKTIIIKKAIWSDGPVEVKKTFYNSMAHTYHLVLCLVVLMYGWSWLVVG